METYGKVVLANSTVVYKEGNVKYDSSWMKRVNERNQAMQEIAEELNLALNDLFTVSENIPKEYRYVDGIHYLTEGYAVLAEQVVKVIKSELR